MANLLEMTVAVVASHASANEMTTQELLNEIANVYNALALIEKGEVAVAEPEVEQALSKADVKKSIGKNSITCLVCGKGGFKTLTRHLKTAHDMKPGVYRKQFGIPSKQSLAAKSYSESRRQMAIEKGLGEGLAKARAARGKAKAAKPAAAKRAAAKKK